MTDDSLLAQAREWVGRAANQPATARDPVNVPMIRRWCEAMGETNAIYFDESAAKAAGHPGIVAPPAMLEVWTMAPYRPGGRTAEEGMAVLNLFDEAGYTGVVATNTRQEYDRYLVPGDVITSTPIVDDVSDEKRTALGIGHFVTLRYEFTDASDKRVGRMTFRVLKFKPNLAQPKAEATEEGGENKFPHPRPAITHDNAFYWEGLSNRKLLFQSTDGRLRHPPGPMDPVSGSLEFDIVESSGRGTIHSFVVMHQPRLPGFEYPLPVVLVELEEGVRLVANVLDADPKEVEIGRKVEVDFVEVEPGYILPAFRLS
ncbi:bifunctional MaoC family dehydratase N-terminal/OB-fold nucleic acid binding domain-containing protein [Pacificimonas sp. ICDLI1SI03]